PELFAEWPDIEARLEGATSLSQLGIDESSEPIEPNGAVPDKAPKAVSPPADQSEGARERRVWCQPAVEMHGRVADWVSEIRRRRGEGDRTLFVADTQGRAERTIELLKEYELFAAPVERAEDAQYAAVLVAVGNLSRGFRLPDAGFQIYAEADVFEEERRAPDRRRSASKAFLSDLRDLKAGDLVVHVDHGIGAFV